MSELIFNEYVNLELISKNEEETVMRVEIQKHHLNFYGYVHGGVYFTMADTTAGYVTISEGASWVTLNSSVNYLKGLTEGSMISKGTCIKRTRKTCVVDVKIYSESNQDLLFTGIFTMYKVA